MLKKIRKTIDFLDELSPKATIIRYTTACLLSFTGIFIGIYAGLWLIKEIAGL